MIITAIPPAGNSSKFHVQSKNGEFNLALSFTLKTKVWQLADSAAELSAAQDLAEAIVSRHNPTLPFKQLYIFAEHNTLPTLVETVRQIRKIGL